MNNLPYFLALNRMEQIGPRTVLKLKKRWPNLQELFQLTPLELEQSGIPARLAQIITQFDLNTINEDLAWHDASPNNHLLTWESPEYPALLKEIADPPIVLYAQGQLSALQQPALAMVGTRNPSINGSENALQFAQHIAAHGVTIVSGLALGIDAQAHLGCLASQGRTIAVLGTGIDHIYPRRHVKLAQQIQERGLLISEFPLKSPPIAGHFPRRNRIISGLSLCILVIEAAIKSGSLITARMALEQNRDVLAIPGSIHNPLARGCHYLLQQGAKLVTSIEDVLSELRLETGQLYSQQLSFQQGVSRNEHRSLHTVNEDANERNNAAENSSTKSITEDKLLSPLAIEAKNLVKFIGFETTTVDQLIMRSGFTIEQITEDLAELELHGTITSVPGGYIRC